MNTSTQILTTPRPVPSNGRRILAGVFAVDRALVFSSAAVLTFGGPLVARLLDWPSLVVIAIGLTLVPYGFLVQTIHSRQAYYSGLARLTALGDGAWVAGSVALILGWPAATSTLGKWFVAIIAAVIAEIGLPKVLGWRRS